MFLGRVVGEVWATRKAADLLGHRLLVVQALDERRDPGAKKVTPVVAADPLGADVGEHVIVAFGKAARVAALGADGDFAFEAAIVGIVDDFDVPGAPEEWKMEDVAAWRAARAKDAERAGEAGGAKKTRGGSP
jgi:ethanolamine utilization protein EutN